MRYPVVIRLLLIAACSSSPAWGESPRIKALFLGDNGPHRPIERAADLIPPLARAGIDVAYTDDLADLNAENLGRYDCLIIYANHPEITPQQEAALLGFVESGHGLVAIHCASYCFLNSPKYIALVGGQFKSHESGVFRPRITADAPHPALENVGEFEAWDETYVHHRLSDDRQVLMERIEKGRREPWTWVREQGRGRVFYTASGHDERVFRKPEFHQLIAQGLRWSVGRPEHAPDLPKPKRIAAKLPNYVAGEKWGTLGEPISDMQAPLSPEDSMRHISTPGGFRVELFAAEPDIVKPIAVAWDDYGRLWVAESVDYPNDLQPEGQGNDRIVICDDTDGDGRADKYTVFADKLSIPTSIVHARGGLIVAQAPHMLFLKDTDGDGRADVREVLFTGFDTRDTHAGPSNLRRGLDNWIYATIGYSGFKGTVGDRPHDFRQGLFRFRPDGSELEVLTSSSNNTWGLGVGETGEIVYSTANGEHSSHLAIPNRYFESVRGWLGKGNARMADHTRMHPIGFVRQMDHHGGFTAAAGHALYTARQFPAQYWNRMALVCEPTGHLVHMCLLEPQGSGFVSRDRFNLFASTDEWTSPIMAEVGPDGAVWVVDWYNYIIQHNPTPLGYETGKGNAYVTPLRDKKHARIYRLVNENAPLHDTPKSLMAGLQSENQFWRLAAQWQLVEAGNEDVVPELKRLVADTALDGTGENLPALHALWTMDGLGAFDEFRNFDVLEQALSHPSPGVRRTALEILPPREESTAALVRAGLLEDPQPIVRRAALLALGELPRSEAAGGLIVKLLNRPENAEDRWIPLAATAAAARHDQGFLTAALASRENTGATRSALRIVAEHFARGEARPLNVVSSVLSGLHGAAPQDGEALLEGLSAGWPRERPLEFSPDAQDALVKLIDRLSPAGQLHLVTLGTRWGLGERFDEALKSLRERMLAEARNAEADNPARIAAVRQVAQMQPDRPTLEAVLDLASPRSDPAFAAGVLDATGQTGSPELGAAIIERWGRFTPALRRQAVDVLLRRPEWTAALVEALEQSAVQAGELSPDQSQQLAAHPNARLAGRARAVLASGGRLPNPDREKVLAELLPLVEQTGDPVLGREVFEKNCAKCHRHGELGQNIGPNLSGFSVHPKSKILTEVIDPNRSVEGNYRQYTVVTEEGRVYNGLLAAETKTAIELVDGQAQRHTLLREEIEEMLASTKSIMPEGFEKQLQPADIANLLEFLAARGKFVPLPLDKVATTVTTRGMFFSREADVERLIFPDWEPKTFAGVPFHLVDPQDGRVPNAILLYGPQGQFPPKMPKSVRVPCHMPAKAIHLLGGVSGWGYPFSEEGGLSVIVRLHYADGETEDHPLRNGEHFADYIRRVDVPGSQFAFALRGQQIRYLAVLPQRGVEIAEIEFVKGPDSTAPVVMAVTVETEAR